MIRRFRDMKLRYKLFLAYSLVFVCIVVGASISVYYFAKSAIEDRIHDELYNSTHTLTSMVETAVDISIENYLRASVDSSVNIVNYYYKAFELGDLSEEEAKVEASRALLNQKISETGYNYIANSDGILLYHPIKELEGQDFSEHAQVKHFVKSRDGYFEYDWLDPVDEKIKPKSIYRKYFEPWGWVVAVTSYREEFMGLIDFDDFRDNFLKIKFGESGYPFVIGFNGDVIMHPDLSGNLLDNSELWPIVEEMIEQKCGMIKYMYKDEGKDYYRAKIAVFEQIPELEWIVVSSGYADELFSVLESIRQTILLSCVLGVIVIVPISVAISSSITRPLSVLAERFSRVSEVDFSDRLEVGSGDEVGELQGYYNLFMQRLGEYSDKLKDEMNDKMIAQEALRESEKTFRLLYEEAPLAYQSLDINGDFLLVNPEWEKMFGYSMDEVRGKSVGMIVGEESKSKQGEVFQQFLRDGRIEKIEFKLVKKDGSEIYAEIDGRIGKDSYGEFDRTHCILRDVTAHREYEKAREKLMRELESKNDELESLVYATSHDLRSPLVNIQGFTQELHFACERLNEEILGLEMEKGKAAEVERLLKEEIPEAVNFVMISASKMDVLQKGLLDVCRLGRAELEIVNVDMNLLVKNVVDSMMYQIERDGGRVEVGELPRCMADGEQLNSVVANLVDNALKYRRDGVGAVVKIEGWCDDGRSYYSVEDNGIGIDGEHLKKIFEMFHRLNPKASSGEGLGLTIAQRIINRLDGRIWVEAGEEFGCKFFIELPSGV